MCELVRLAGEIKGIHDRARAKYDSEQYQVSFDHFDCAKVIERLTDNDTDIFANLKKNKKSSTQLTASICEKHVFDAFVQEGFIPPPHEPLIARLPNITPIAIIKTTTSITTKVTKNIDMLSPAILK